MKQAAADPVALAYHELRSPLGLMVTAANALALEVDDEAVQIRCDAIVRAAERMLRTASQVLSSATVSYPSTGDVFLPEGLVKELAEDFRELGLAVEFRSTALAAETQVKGSTSGFEALVSSLLMNAGDHREPGTPIRLSCAANDDTFCVEINNTVASSDAHEGLSLGASICANLARWLDAIIEAESGDGIYRVRVTIHTIR